MTICDTNSLTESSGYFREKQRQCQALARGTTWKATIQALQDMAAEFGIKADAAEAAEQAAGSRTSRQGLSPGTPETAT
jgi:hypothetical protein